MIAKHSVRLLLLLTLTFALYAGAYAQERIDVSDTQEILITSLRPSERLSGRQKGDEALLIRDKAEVSKLVSLFDKNLQSKVHACGYQWRLTFLRTGAPPTDIYFNEKCEEFERNTDKICEIVQTKFRQTVAKPNSYVSILDIDVNVIPETARTELTSKGRLRVLDREDINRLPFIELRAASTSKMPADRARWNAEKVNVILAADRALINDIARIRRKYDVVEIGEITHGSSMFGGGEIMEQRRVKLYFDVGTNLENIGSLLNQSKVEATSVPAVYNLQVLTDHRLTQPEIEELQKNLPFIKTIRSH